MSTKIQRGVGTEKKQMERSESDVEYQDNNECEYKGEFFGEFPYFIGIGDWSAAPSEQSENVEGPISTLESAAMVCLLEDSINELMILKYVIGAPKVVWDLQYRTLKERYTRRLTPVRIYPEGESKHILTTAIKLQRDRESIETVFYKLSKSLEEEKSYSPLTKALESLRKQEEDDHLLVEELKRNLLYIKDLKLRVEEKRKLDEREEKERDELMYHLQDELDDVFLKCGVEEKFVNKWENVRNAQNQWKFHLAENFLKDNIIKFATKAKIEKRVTHELQMYLKACQGELEEQLEEWMARYDYEMERRENKIIHLKYSRDQAEEKKNNLQQLYKERSLEMKEWVKFREVRKLRIKASLSIQSWWRGLMVRKRLGPYKPKKQKEKLSKKKK